MWSGQSVSDLLAIVTKQQDDIVRLRQEHELVAKRVESKLDTLIQGQASSSREQGGWVRHLKSIHVHLVLHFCTVS